MLNYGIRQNKNCARFYKTQMIYSFVKEIFPLVDRELDKWMEEALAIPCGELRVQAVASMIHKKFHAQGGSIYGLYPGIDRENLIRFIVSFQTISDYLDNLCDRVGCLDEQAFRQLHLSYLDAVTPDGGIAPYYRYYPFKEDNGYLEKLVEECRRSINRLPNYAMVRKPVHELAALYCDLQSYKHIDPDLREEKVIEWAQGYPCSRYGISSWEFAAATGSTLGIFMLCAAASLPGITPQDVQNIQEAYFPWVCGLHILLDYFIDQEEDRNHRDLNLVSYYRHGEEQNERMNYFVKRSLDAVQKLSNAPFHVLVVKGLISMYLSDDKVKDHEMQAIRKGLINSCGPGTGTMFRVCRLLRMKKRL